MLCVPQGCACGSHCARAGGLSSAHATRTEFPGSSSHHPGDHLRVLCPLPHEVGNGGHLGPRAEKHLNLRHLAAREAGGASATRAATWVSTTQCRLPQYSLKCRSAPYAGAGWPTVDSSRYGLALPAERPSAQGGAGGQVRVNCTVLLCERCVSAAELRRMAPRCWRQAGVTPAGTPPLCPPRRDAQRTSRRRHTRTGS